MSLSMTLSKYAADKQQTSTYNNEQTLQSQYPYERNDKSESSIISISYLSAQGMEFYA